jgi:hypothetical protein
MIETKIDMPRPFFFLQLAKSVSFGWHVTFSGSLSQGQQNIRGMGYQFFGLRYLLHKNNDSYITWSL